jgi:epoxyqueuosine reductase
LNLGEQIREEGRKLGFDAVGIAGVESFEPHDARDSFVDTLCGRLLAWLHQGYQGRMHWMARDPERRGDPRKVLPGCRSVICVGLNYYTDHRADESPGHGRIARYAWGTDYHLILDARLEELERAIHHLAPDAQTRRYVDTGPVMEKAWAERAGLGWIGKHSNLVSARHGSWLVLGEILTSLDLTADDPGTDLCGSCTLCIRACPTGAITEPYVVDARRCISYLTIELRDIADTIADELRRPMGNRIFGCDDCLEVCPYNTQATATREPGFQPSTVSLAPKLEPLAVLTEADFQHLFRRSPIRRAKLHGFLRNVRVALENLTSSVSGA